MRAMFAYLQSLLRSVSEWRQIHWLCDIWFNHQPLRCSLQKMENNAKLNISFSKQQKSLWVVQYHETISITTVVGQLKGDRWGGGAVKIQIHTQHTTASVTRLHKQNVFISMSTLFWIYNNLTWATYSLNIGAGKHPQTVGGLGRRMTSFAKW